MGDMSQVIVPKSDQFNAEDFLAGPRTFRIESVDIRAGEEQPVSIRLAGEKRVFRPCKSMSRVLVAAWGPDAKVYAGRSLTLYRDPNVKWGGLAVGGIRISHMSDIDGKKTMMLTETRAKRAPHVVQPLQDVPANSAQADDPAQRFANGYMNRLEQIETSHELEEYAHTKAPDIDRLAEKRPELAKQCAVMLDQRRNELSGSARRTDEQHGDQFSGTDSDAPAEF